MKEGFFIRVTDLKPTNVFCFFNEITKIPRSSGNTSQITDYCINFAEKRKLKAVKDSSGNVIIYKNGTKGYENSSPLILQGHLDMVWDTDSNNHSNKIKATTNGKFVWAENSTLGADNGIGVAYILSILDSTNIPHPPIEALFTVDEEIGMIGANNLDASLLKGKRLINIDSENEGVLTVSCAGGVRIACKIPVNYTFPHKTSISYEIEIKGLYGGHSGIDINKHRKNASVVCGRLLQSLFHYCNINIANIFGNNKVNSIPNKCKAIVSVNKRYKEKFENIIINFEKIVKQEYCQIEPNLSINFSICNTPEKICDKHSTETIIFTLLQIPKGVQSMSPDIPHMVQTSLNFGNMALKDNSLVMNFLVRSNASTGKQFAVQKLTSFINFLKGEYEILSDYPVWEYKTNSPIRNIMVETYKEIYGEEPIVTSLHAGLECGILSGKIYNADIISLGPNIYDVHTTKEKLDVLSTQRCYEYLIKAIEKCK